MFRQLALLAVVACAALTAPIESFDDIPAEYKSLIPAEVAEHLKSITAEEKAALKDLVKEHKNFKNEEEALAALKEKSPSLHEKAVKMHAFVNAKVDRLGDEAKEFVKKVIAEARAIHREHLLGNKPSIEDLKAKVKAQITAFQALSEEAKGQFKTEFPIISAAIANPQIKALAEKYIN